NRDLVRDFPAEERHREHLSAALDNLGGVLESQGRREAAEAATRESVRLQYQLAEEFPLDPDFVLSLADSISNLGFLLSDSGRPAEAEAEYRRILKLLDQAAAR